MIIGLENHFFGLFQSGCFTQVLLYLILNIFISDVYHGIQNGHCVKYKIDEVILSYVVWGSEIMSCNKIDKPQVVYRFS